MAMKPPFNITPHYAKLPQSLASSLGGAAAALRLRPSGSRNRRYVLRPACLPCELARLRRKGLARVAGVGRPLLRRSLPRFAVSRNTATQDQSQIQNQNQSVALERARLVRVTARAPSSLGAALRR